jgi:pyrroline-5-carboxylate reductase
MTTSCKNLTFIGGGNMATALIAGLMRQDEPPRIRVSDPDAQARARLESGYDVETFDDAVQAAQGADVVVLAVKPQVMPRVLESLEGRITGDQVVLSIAAGTPIDQIRDGLQTRACVVRSMPNTPALLGRGISGVCASPGCGQAQKDRAEFVLAAAGEVVWVDDESLMDAVTAISGSGPAYFFLLTESLAAAGESLGLPRDTAARLALHTCRGAGSMLASGEADAAELRRRVTSPGGTTQAALDSFEASGFREIVGKAARAARDRGRELAK